MSSFSNVETFFNQYPKAKEISLELSRLIEFTENSKLVRDLLAKNLFVKEISGSSKKKYFFRYNKKKYPFLVFSDLPLQEWKVENEQKRNL